MRFRICNFLLADFIFNSNNYIYFQEKFEKELKDARARELMHAEEAAILEKVLKPPKTFLLYILAFFFLVISIDALTDFTFQLP